MKKQYNKVSKNQKTLYANEKAINDVEAYLGGEAVGVANNVYEHILKNYVVTDGATNTTTALSTTAATAKFREYYFKGYVDALTPSKSITGVSTKSTKLEAKEINIDNLNSTTTIKIEIKLPQDVELKYINYDTFTH